MEDFLFSIEIMVVGFSVVLVVLFALYFIFQGFGTFLTNDAAKREARKAERVNKEKEKTETKILSPIPDAGPDSGIDTAEPGLSPEILAVITAAVSAYMEKPGYQLRIKKVRRGNHLTPWVLSRTEDVIITYGREN